MLFKRLYNWIKYKTLPTSFLFKNRLFIERDSKHRRIYNLFGSTFRNSIWGNHELVNLKKKLKLQFYYFLPRLAIWTGVFLSWLYRKYFNDVDFYGFICFFGWVCFEYFDYCFVFSVWLVLHIFYSLLYWFYTYFLEQFFGVSLEKPDLSTRRFFALYNKKFKDKTNKDIQPSFKLNGYFYVWICTLKNEDQKYRLACLLQQHITQSEWARKYAFFRQLYRVIYFSNLFNNNLTIVKGVTTTQFNTIPTINLLTLKTNALVHLSATNFVLKNLINFTKLNKTTYQHKLYNSYLIEQLYSTNATQIIQGNFYLNDLSFVTTQHISNMVQDFFTLIKNQTHTTKWDRWLYRYSVLHRRILKNSHKLTITKYLLQSGFYDHRLISYNPWMNHRASKLNRSLATHINLLYYGAFFKSGISSSWVKPTTLNTGFLPPSLHLNNFAHYENSFFWFIKRFYLFNTLSANNNKTKLILTNFDKPFISDTSQLLHYLTMCNLSSAVYKNAISDFSLQNLPKELFNLSSVVLCKNNSYFVKDFSITHDSADLFSLELLDILYWIINNTSSELQQPVCYFLDTTISYDLFDPSFSNSKKFKSTHQTMPESRWLFEFQHDLSTDLRLLSTAGALELCNTNFL